ncbi:MAG: BrnT family toxin [Methanosarcinales archaeon]|nr:BrnT family toxin [Methanosarcinales archaeon]
MTEFRIRGNMVDWRRTKPEFTIETYSHIKKHGVKRFEVEDVFNNTFLPLKVRVNDEIRYIVLGESFGRILMVIVTPLPGNNVRIISAYEPSNRYKKLYRKKCKR